MKRSPSECSRIDEGSPPSSRRPLRARHPQGDAVGLRPLETGQPRAADHGVAPSSRGRTCPTAAPTSRPPPRRWGTPGLHSRVRFLADVRAACEMCFSYCNGTPHCEIGLHAPAWVRLTHHDPGPAPRGRSPLASRAPRTTGTFDTDAQHHRKLPTAVWPNQLSREGPFQSTRTRSLSNRLAPSEKGRLRHYSSAHRGRDGRRSTVRGGRKGVSDFGEHSRSFTAHPRGDPTSGWPHSTLCDPWLGGPDEGSRCGSRRSACWSRHTVHERGPRGFDPRWARPRRFFHDRSFTTVLSTVCR
jgi:hypothetical protein